MTTATLPVSHMPSRTAPKRKGWFGRFIDRMIEARTRQAELHVQELLRRLSPEFLEQAGYTPPVKVRKQAVGQQSVGEKWTLPFVRGA